MHPHPVDQTVSQAAKQLAADVFEAFGSTELEPLQPAVTHCAICIGATIAESQTRLSIPERSKTLDNARTHAYQLEAWLSLLIDSHPEHNETLGQLQSRTIQLLDDLKAEVRKVRFSKPPNNSDHF